MLLRDHSEDTRRLKHESGIRGGRKREGKKEQRREEHLFHGIHFIIGIFAFSCLPTIETNRRCEEREGLECLA